LRGTDIQRLCDERGWSRSRLVKEMRRAARSPDEILPSDDSLKRMLRQWINGDRGSEQRAALLSAVFGVPFEAAAAPVVEVDEASAVLTEHLARARSSLDVELIDVFQGQTQSLRVIDRRLGARRLLVQSESHVQQMSDVLAYALGGTLRAALAGALAQASSLAGWQALDLGRPDRAWALYEAAKSAARESRDPAVLAHVTAEQAYTLMDLGRVDDAVEQIRHARQVSGRRIPAMLRAWLWAAEAEALAAAGEDHRARAALDQAEWAMSRAGGDVLPYVFLNEMHFARWRGHCLARLGAAEAVDELTRALDGLDPSFTRARAGLHCDLALAHAARGELDAVRAHAARSTELAEATTSARQKRRLEKLAGFTA
jgi:tetratricopeptide (TPR) repeat protein